MARISKLSCELADISIIPEFEPMTQELLTEIKNIKDLKSRYDKLSSMPFYHDAKEAYRTWYEQSCVLFNRYFDESCKEYVNFLNVDNSGEDGYLLYNNYQKIRKDFCVLLDVLEHSELYKADVLNTDAKNVKMPRTAGKRIFISHSSSDQEVVGRFVDSVLLLGMKVDSALIAYTSREDTGVAPGENIPEFIRDNIACADVVLLMISDNYKSSEVCLNEMGAALALEKKIVQILLPNISVDRLGWLCSLDKALKIDDSNALDALCEVFEDILDVHVKLSVWNRNKVEFLKTIHPTGASELPLVPVQSAELQVLEDEDLGFLDYRERFQDASQMVTTIYELITNGLKQSNVKVSLSTRQLKSMNSYSSSVPQIKAIMRNVARSMNELAEIQEQNTPLLKIKFFEMVDNAVKLKECISPKVDVEAGYDTVKGLIVSIAETKDTMIEMRNSIDALPNAEALQNKAKKRLSTSQTMLINVLDECLVKSKELVGVI